jgi:hypothetical protein
LGKYRLRRHGAIFGLAGQKEIGMSNNELTAAALRWHATRTVRLTIGARKRKLDAQEKAGGDCGWSLQRRMEQIDVDRELAEARRHESAAMRALAKACAMQRSQLQGSDVIELDGAVTLLPA